MAAVMSVVAHMAVVAMVGVPAAILFLAWREGEFK